MEYIRLGKKGPVVSEIGYGSWGISGRDWGKSDDNESAEAIKTALNLGVNFIDTADVYGFGHSEELIAGVLGKHPDRDKIIIATKAGNNFYPEIGHEHRTTPINHDYSVKHLVFAAEQSLKRLRRETLDILQLHSPGLEMLETDEPWLALEKLKRDGKIKHAGWSVQSFQETTHAHILERHHELIDVIQVRYNLLEREAEKVLFPMALKYGTGVIVRIPLLFGLLAGKFTRETTFGDNDHRRTNLSPEKLNSYLSEFERLAPIYRKFTNHTVAQVSLNFCLAHPACHTVIPGGKTTSQVKENTLATRSGRIGSEEFGF